MVSIPNHTHCIICGRAIAFGETLCGTECQKKLDDQNRRRKRTMLMIYIAMAVSLGLLLLEAYFFR